MAVTSYDLFLEKGTTFNAILNLIDDNNASINLVGYYVYSQAKKSYFASDYVVNFDIGIIEACNGIISITTDAETTANITSTQLHYDVMIEDDSNNVTRVLKGQIFVYPSVTR